MSPFLRYFSSSIHLRPDFPFRLTIPIIHANHNIPVHSSFKLISDELNIDTTKYYIEGSNFTDKIVTFDIRIPEFIRPRRYRADITIKLDPFGLVFLSLNADLN